MLCVMPARLYLTELVVAAAQSLAELPRGRCDEAVADRILERLAPYVGDAAAAFCDFDDVDATLSRRTAADVPGRRPGPRPLNATSLW
jgi:hypothetical protein